jgi:hypothetical protein
MAILSEAGRNKHGQKLVRAECACGNTFIAREDNIKAGRSKHCENCRKKPAKKITPEVRTESVSTFERGSAEWIDDQIKSKVRAALAAEIRVKNLQQLLAETESTDLNLLKQWTAESTAFEKLNHQISRLQIQKDKALTATVKDVRTQAQVNRDKIAALRGQK